METRNPAISRHLLVCTVLYDHPLCCRTCVSQARNSHRPTHPPYENYALRSTHSHPHSHMTRVPLAMLRYMPYPALRAISCWAISPAVCLQSNSANKMFFMPIKYRNFVWKLNFLNFLLWLIYWVVYFWASSIEFK